MLVTRNITKKFSGVTALNDVNITLYPGQVNAIIGENGAGKSTLMKILSGVYTAYEGTILYNGEPLQLSGVRDAEKKGIAIIHQELNLVPFLSITENIFLGREIITPLGLLDKRKMQEETSRLLNRLQLKADPGKKVGALKLGEQQMVEIAKALYTEAGVIIMDEPTSAISDKEVDSLFAIIRELRQQGKIIVYISHKMKELYTLADHFVVMRDGCMVDSGRMDEVTQEELIEMMTGRPAVSQREQQGRGAPGKELFRAEKITLKNKGHKDRLLLDDISFTIHEGEILGLYGLMGSGRTELLECIFGLHPHRSQGRIFINGKEQHLRNPQNAITAGIALVPEDRKTHGLMLEQKIRTNISITVLQQLEKWGVMLNRRQEENLCRDYITKLAIKTSDTENRVSSLSGGNQQKIVLAKWLATHPLVLLLDEPTRGIDINAKFEIYALMKEWAARGMGVLIVSSELPEILAVSDRILVMAEGRLTADLDIAAATENQILKYAIQHN